jgi:hypothetical protein
LQPRYEWTQGETGAEGQRLYFRRLRVDLHGGILDGRLTFRLQSDLKNRGRLRDAYLDYAVRESVGIRVGKQSVPFEWRVSPRREAFPEKDIATATFGSPSRDIGVLLQGNSMADRLEYALGLLDGNGGHFERPSEGRFMLTSRISYALRGLIPRDETDPHRMARGNVVVGVGGQAAVANNLGDWSLGRSSTGDQRGSWRSVVVDALVQHSGFTATAKSYHRSVVPSDRKVAEYDGSARMVSIAATIAKGVEVLSRAAWSDLDHRDVDTHSSQWGIGLNVYHRDHSVKSRMHYMVLEPPSPAGTKTRRVLVADFSYRL